MKKPNSATEPSALMDDSLSREGKKHRSLISSRKWEMTHYGVFSPCLSYCSCGERSLNHGDVINVEEDERTPLFSLQQRAPGLRLRGTFGRIFTFWASSSVIPKHSYTFLAPYRFDSYVCFRLPTKNIFQKCVATFKLHWRQYIVGANALNSVNQYLPSSLIHINRVFHAHCDECRLWRMPIVTENCPLRRCSYYTFLVDGAPTSREITLESMRLWVILGSLYWRVYKGALAKLSEAKRNEKFDF
jgi:hypothetical protein